MATTLSWVVECTCCCNDEQVHYEAGENRMKCVSCSCRRDRPSEVAVGVLATRVMIRGQITLGIIEQATELARVLGADEQVVLRRANQTEHYLDVPAEAILSRLMIAKLSGKS